MKLEQLRKKRNTEEFTAYGHIYPFKEKKDDRIHADINYCEILSRLIQEAGAVCNYYASDIFISWNSVLNKISKFDEEGTLVEYFGFREMGVDHESFIRTRLANEECYGKDYYKSIFKLETKIKGSDITMTLSQVK